MNSDMKKYVSGDGVENLPQVKGFGTNSGMVLYSSDMELNSPSIIKRPTSPAAHFRKYAKAVSSACFTFNLAVRVHLDCPNLLAEITLVPEGKLLRTLSSTGKSPANAGE